MAEVLSLAAPGAVQIFSSGLSAGSAGWSHVRALYIHTTPALLQIQTLSV